MRRFCVLAALLVPAMASAAAPACTVQSRPTVTPVIELYTSEGCSSCPPADRWASSLKAQVAAGKAVVQAFHVGYWDSLGWVDRFASPAYTARQRQVGARNRQSSIYTPQVVRDGQDWRDWRTALESRDSARAALELRRSGDDAYEASVQPADAGLRWSAYWTVTEHDHASKVRAGENAGEFLHHDFVVRQYVPAGDYRGASTLSLRTLMADPAHPRQVNLVVFDPRNGRTLQAVSAGC